ASVAGDGSRVLPDRRLAAGRRRVPVPVVRPRRAPRRLALADRPGALTFPAGRRLLPGGVALWANVPRPSASSLISPKGPPRPAARTSSKWRAFGHKKPATSSDREAERERRCP